MSPKIPPRPKRNSCGRVFAVAIAPFLSLALCFSAAHAQTLQLRYTFEETGTTANSSGALNVPLSLLSFANAPTDLHGGANSGVQNQGQSLDLSAAANAAGNTISGPVAQATADTTLASGLGVVSNFTATMWFKEQTLMTNTAGIAGRMFVIGTNTITDQNQVGSIGVWFQNTNVISLRFHNGATLTAPVYYNPLPTNVWFFLAVTYDGSNDAAIYLGSEINPVRRLAVRSIGLQTLNLGTHASLMLGNRISDRTRAFDGWIDEFRFYTGEGTEAFLEGVRQASTPVLVTGLNPDGGSLMQGTNLLTFNANSASGIDPSGIKVAVNGADVSGSLTIGGTATARTVSYTNLPVNPTLVNNASLNAVSVRIHITDLAGIVTSNTYSYDAFSPGNFTVEAEDFNYGTPLSGPGGLYIDNPRYAFESAVDTYWQREGFAGADYNDVSGAGGHVYRGPLDLVATEFSASAGNNGGPSVGELMREKVRDAFALTNIIREVNVGNFDTGEWMNYTRTYPTGPFNVYARVANGGAAKIVNFSRVTGDTTQPGQGSNTLGTFSFPNTGGWQSYFWVPLRDSGGNLLRVDLAGLDTFRLTATPGGGGNYNLFMLTPANTNLPTISGIYPNGTNMFQPSATFSFNATSPIGATINSNSIFVTLTRTTIQGTVVTNLTSTNGLTITGSSSSRNVSAPLITNANYTAVVNVTDVNGASAGTSVTFDTYNPVFTWEAEDYNHSNGQTVAEPQTNGYAGQVGGAEVDYHDNVVVSQNATPVYRTGDPVGLENTGDAPLRLAYIGSGFTDINVGWYDGGNWNNYTRAIPAGDYNVLLRAANGSGGNGGVTLARVTSDPTQTGQTTTNLGSFTIPATGGWQTYTWVPMRDSGGNLVKFTGGGTQTLRATSSGGCNANFYALVPANTNLPTINNIYPNGAALFQKTNRLSFNVSSLAGVNSNSIVVTLDGVVLTNLTFTGSATAWSVSYLGLTQNTNHTASISVTDLNGNAASTTVNFDTFPANLFTWEAEDYDFDGGLYTNGVDAYLGLNAVPDVDYHEVNTGGTFTYRPNGTATEITSDLTRSQFVGTNDYNIGFFAANEWGNYTREYPAGNYNVWGRFAAGGGDTSAELSEVTSGWGTTSQTTNFLGTFVIGNSGWTSFSWAPLRDSLGNLVKVSLTGATNTLKFAHSPTGPDVNVNFLMLAPTPGPVQLTIVRNGANADVSFPTQTGLNYQLQFKNEVTDASWTSLGSLIVGDATTKTISDPLGPQKRFYRLWIQQ